MSIRTQCRSIQVVGHNRVLFGTDDSIGTGLRGADGEYKVDWEEEGTKGFIAAAVIDVDRPEPLVAYRSDSAPRLAYTVALTDCLAVCSIQVSFMWSTQPVVC